MPGRRTQLGAAFAIAAASLIAALGLAITTACTDGATPDCSDANAGCGPDLDGSLDDGEAGTDSATGAQEAGPIADAANEG